jgi:hypothetical protein
LVADVDVVAVAAGDEACGANPNGYVVAPGGVVEQRADAAGRVGVPRGVEV